MLEITISKPATSISIADQLSRADSDSIARAETKSAAANIKAATANSIEPATWLIEHGNVLFKFALLRVNNRHVAEDLVQETLVRGFAALDSFRGESSIRTWLFQILRNEINRHYRVRKRERSQRDTDVGAESANETLAMEALFNSNVSRKQFATALEREEFWNAIQTCFERVPDHLLDTFLHRLANPDVSIEKLAADLGIKPANFSVRLFRTRLLLRHCVEKTWFS